MPARPNNAETWEMNNTIIFYFTYTVFKLCSSIQEAAFSSTQSGPGCNRVTGCRRRRLFYLTVGPAQELELPALNGYIW